MWILIGIVLVLLLIGALVALLRNRGTVYIFRSNGYTAFEAGGTSHPHHTSEEGLQKAVKRLLPADVFDMLWVSTRDDEYSGAILTVESGTPVLSLSFKTHSDQVKLGAFKKAMASSGFTGTEDSNGFNGGLGEEFRVTRLEYRLPQSSDKILEAIKSALANLDPGARNGYFVKGSSFRDIAGSRPGVKFVRDSDPLQDLP